MDGLPTDVGGVIVRIISEAYTLYKRYEARNAEQAAFAKFMQRVAQNLEGVKDSVPQHARPVACDLAALVGVAEAKISEYNSRGLASILLHLRSEKACRQAIIQGVQQLLPLLTLSVASPADIRAAVGDLDCRAESIHRISAEAAEHFRHMRAAVEAIAKSPGPTSAAAIEDSIATLALSMQRMHKESVEAVLEGFEAMEHTQIAGFEKLELSVTDLRSAVGSLSEQMLSSHSQLTGDMQELKEVISAAASIRTISALSAVTQTTVRLQGDDEPGGSDVDTPPADVHVSSFRGWTLREKPVDVASPRVMSSSDPPTAAAAQATHSTAAVTRVAKQIFPTSCPLWGYPFMPEGPMRPVQLSCCRFIISNAACAAHYRRSTLCIFCSAMKPSDWIQPVLARPFKTIISMHTGISGPRAIRTSEVQLVEGGEARAGAGFGTSVWESGKVRQAVVRKNAFKLPVTAKVIHIGDTGTREGVAWVRKIISVHAAAALGSPHVCKMMGFCWTDSELWLLMRRCEGSLADFIQHNSQHDIGPRLPPLDVVSLGLSMCCALGALHRRVKCMHLDVTPHNILLKKTDSHSMRKATGRSKLWVPLLSDFCLADRLGVSFLKSAIHRRNLNWRSPIDSMVGSKANLKGTPGYAPHEQLMRRSQVRSDVYSLGMTLLYAATGHHAHARKTRAGSSSGDLDVEPEHLRSLLLKMTMSDVMSRPHINSVQRELMQLYRALTAAGATPQYIVLAEDDMYTTIDGTGANWGTATVPGRSGVAADHRSEDQKGEPSVHEGSVHTARTPDQGSSSISHGARRVVSSVVRGLRKLTVGRANLQADDQISAADHVHEAFEKVSTRQAQHDQQATSAMPVDEWVKQQAKDVAESAVLKVGPAPATAEGAAKKNTTSIEASAPEVRQTDSALNMKKLFHRNRRARGQTSTAASTVSALETATSHLSQLQGAETPEVSAEVTSAGGRATVEDALRRLAESKSASKRRPSQVHDFGGATLHLTSDWKEAADSLVIRKTGDASQRRAQICRGAGTIANAILDLGENGELVLHGCADVEFLKTTFKRGSVIGRGPRCKLKLTDVNLEGCLLTLHDRVTVNIIRMRSFWLASPETQASPSRPRAVVPLYTVGMRDAGTTVHAENMRLDRGIRVFHGAKFIGNDVHVTLTGDAKNCITVRGQGARAELTHSGLTVDTHEQLHGTPKDRCGVIADAGASISVSDTFVNRVSRGLRVRSGARMQLQNCTVTAGTQGMLMTDIGTIVEASITKIRGGKMAIGVEVNAVHQLKMQECDVGRVVHMKFVNSPSTNHAEVPLVTETE